MLEAAVIEERVCVLRQRLAQLTGAPVVKIMAAAKFQPRESVLAAIRAGIDLVGENRVQEAQEKWGADPPAVPLHLIGHLQTNKVKYAIRLFHSIDSVDSDRLADMLDHLAVSPFHVMVEVNVGGETSKFGMPPGEVFDFLARGERFSHLRVTGLMTVLPAVRENSVEERRIIRGHMQEMAKLWRMCRSEGWPWAPLGDLSMGMSGDWEWAVEAGATIIRIGTGIFGPRPLSNV